MIILTHVLTIAGSYCFSAIAKHFGDRRMILVCSIGAAATLPFLPLGNTAVFLVVYALLYFFIIILNNAVPLTLTKVIDYNVIGQYSAGRMLLNTLGTSLAGFLCIPLFRTIGVVPALLLAGGMQLFSGFSYYIMLKRFPQQVSA